LYRRFGGNGSLCDCGLGSFGDRGLCCFGCHGAYNCNSDMRIRI
jgi:hypothetical protein